MKKHLSALVAQWKRELVKSLAPKTFSLPRTKHPAKLKYKSNKYRKQLDIIETMVRNNEREHRQLIAKMDDLLCHVLALEEAIYRAEEDSDTAE